jgi:hypothetical protein
MTSSKQDSSLWLKKPNYRLEELHECPFLLTIPKFKIDPFMIAITFADFVRCLISTNKEGRASEET